MYKVYMWINTKNGKRYIGTTGTTMEKRAGKDGYHYQGSPRFYAAIQKYGFDAFTYTILEDNLTKDEAAEKESMYIAMYKTMDPSIGYNLQDGGFPAFQHDSRARAEKISATLKEERSSPEYRKVMSERMQKVWDDPERRADILAKRKAVHPNGAHRRPVFCVELDRLFPNCKSLAEALGVSRERVSQVLKGGNGSGIITAKDGNVYTIQDAHVHAKEEELQGHLNAFNAQGNLQPSLDDEWDIPLDIDF
jgi:group I intron endonuclease